jgi:pentose-5-phosphate-3-epimerase
MREPAIVASVLGADYARLGQEVAELETAGVDPRPVDSWPAPGCRS